MRSFGVVLVATLVSHCLSCHPQRRGLLSPTLFPTTSTTSSSTSSSSSTSAALALHRPKRDILDESEYYLPNIRSMPIREFFCYESEKESNQFIWSENNNFEDLVSWPWLASIYVNNGSLTRIACRGSLITATSILTTASCLPTAGSQLAVQFSTDDAILNVASTKVHSYYDRVERKNDIAILKLDSPVTFTPKIHPICFSVLYTWPEKNVFLGLSKIDPSVDRFRKLHIHNDNSVCNQYDESKSKYCVYGDYLEQVNMSSIENGSPLIHIGGKKWTLYGLASPLSAQNSLEPRFYTAIPNYSEWIIDNL